MRIRSTFLLSLTLGLAACGGGGGGESNSPTVLDVTAPKIISAALDDSGQNIVLTFDEALNSITAPSSTFKVSAGTTAVSVGEVSVTGSTVKLKLGSTIARGQSVLLSYSAPDANAGATNNSVQDLVGNDASSITNFSVTVPAAPVSENPVILIGGASPTLNAAGEYTASIGAKITISDAGGRLSSLRTTTQNSSGQTVSTAQSITSLSAQKYEVSFPSAPSGGLTTITFSSFEPAYVLKLRWN